MRQIKGIVLGCVCGVYLCGNPVTAQTVADGKPLSLSVHARTDTRQQTYLKVRMELKLDSLRLGKKQARVFTPVLSDGANRMALRPIVVNGSWRHLLYLRSSDGKKDEALAVSCGKKGAGTVEYVDSCAYSPWMREAKLWLAEDLCGCGGNLTEQSLRLLLTEVERTEEKKTEVTEKVSERMTVSNQAMMYHKVERVTLYLDFLAFPVNRTDVLPDFGNNRYELGKLTNAVDSLLNLPGAQVELVNMTGYASPEGSYENNERLAYGRTVALRDYLQKIVRYRELPFKTASVAEDWEGLKKAIQESDMPYREEILQIIATKMLPDEKKEKMKFLDRGNAYKILKKDFLPKLRRTVCEIHYTVKENEK